MSITDMVPASRVQTNVTPTFDHSINLIDSTEPLLPQVDFGADLNNEPSAASNAHSKLSRGVPLSKRWTRGALREELARRKYAKWQEQKIDDNEIRSGESIDDKKPVDLSHASVMRGRLRNRLAFGTGKRVPGTKKDQEHEIDVLYENQRGSFFFGIPLYSSKSLLNLDPSAWQTAHFKDSPVTIRDYQLPDPSWQWVWRTWYVDMSYDVDEEGWQYSFSFSPGFAWHGTHPWFHSFVRRRRWLRKRVKIRTGRAKLEQDNSEQAHMLTADYFTIHTGGDKRRVSSEEGTINQSSIAGFDGDQSDLDTDTEEISDIAALMRALKKAAVDRAKIEAIQNFLEHGGDELYYLAERMDDIMLIFIYQDSRRQLLAHLLHTLDNASPPEEENLENEASDAEKLRRRTENLRKAVHAADQHVKSLEYWSDMKDVAEEGEKKAITGKNQGWSEGSQSLDVNGPAGEHEHSEQGSTRSPNIEDDLKGITEDAHISKHPGILWKPSPGAPSSEASSALDKGKKTAWED